MGFNFENELENKIALVTGGSKWAGKAIADRLVKAGATVIITARNRPEDENDGVYFVADFSKPEGMPKVVDDIIEKFGRLDILVNNMDGSETPGGGFAVLSDRDWNRLFRPICWRPRGSTADFYRVYRFGELQQKPFQ